MLNLQGEMQLIRRILEREMTVRELLLMWLAFPDELEAIDPCFLDRLPESSYPYISSVIRSSIDLTEAELYVYFREVFPELRVNGAGVAHQGCKRVFDENTDLSRLFQLRSAA